MRLDIPFTLTTRVRHTTGWKSKLTDHEIDDMTALESRIQLHRDEIAALQEEKAGIRDRAKKRLKRSVDKG